MTTSDSGGSGRDRLALVALSLAFLVVQLDVTVVNVALEAIGRDLGAGGTAGGAAGVGDQQWIVASYTVALAAGMLTAGSAGDRVGARKVCLLGLGLFGLASAACALAPSMPWLIAARTAQGVGAAALLPCSLALIVRQFPDPARRARALGTWGGFGSLGMALGPLAGGLLITLVDWRAIFLVNVPFCLVTALMVRRAVARAAPVRAGRPDLAGLALGTLALGALTGGSIEAGQRGWDDPLAAVLLITGVVGAVAVVLVERRVGAPMVPPSLFASRRFSGGVAVGGVFNLGIYGVLLVVSLVLQGPLALAPWSAGLAVLPMTAAVALGSTLSGRLTARVGPRVPMLLGLGAGVAGSGLLALGGSRPSVGLVVAGSVVLGCVSVAMPALTAVAMSGVPADRVGVGSGVLTTARQAGGALGAAVLGSLLSLGHGSLTGPMLAAALAYLAGIGAALVATRPTPGPPGSQPSSPEMVSGSTPR
ncbi:MFS transporter [Actinomycetospora sp. C-140]